ncbi:MAG: hypothetical protein CMP20_04920 [Rickettsiales bacterium]|nr:hypothetical protein [Rickettsiales bacterium]
MDTKGNWSFAFEMRPHGSGYKTAGAKAHPLALSLDLDKGKVVSHDAFGNLSEIHKTFKNDKTCVITDNLTAPCTIYQIVGLSHDEVDLDNSLYRFKVYPHKWVSDATAEERREWSEW